MSMTNSRSGSEDDALFTLNIGGDLITVKRKTMLQAPKGSLMRSIFQVGSKMLLECDDELRPFFDFPPVAFRAIADHLRLLHMTPQAYVLPALRPPAEQRRQVEVLAWNLGVDELLFTPQLGRASGRMNLRELPARRSYGAWLCCGAWPCRGGGFRSNNDAASDSDAEAKPIAFQVSAKPVRVAQDNKDAVIVNSC